MAACSLAGIAWHLLPPGSQRGGRSYSLACHVANKKPEFPPASDFDQSTSTNLVCQQRLRCPRREANPLRVASNGHGRGPWRRGHEVRRGQGGERTRVRKTSPPALVSTRRPMARNKGSTGAWGSAFRVLRILGRGEG